MVLGTGWSPSPFEPIDSASLSVPREKKKTNKKLYKPTGRVISFTF